MAVSGTSSSSASRTSAAQQAQRAQQSQKPTTAESNKAGETQDAKESAQAQNAQAPDAVQEVQEQQRVRATQEVQDATRTTNAGVEEATKSRQFQAPPPTGTAAARGIDGGLVKRGSRGDRVHDIQEKLNAHGANLEQDGVFGSRTQQAVRDFQRANGLQVDGIVGPETRAALQNPNATGVDQATAARSTEGLARGDRGQAVTDLQQQLNAAGAGISTDGQFGPQTERAVRDYQKAAGLERTGIVDAATQDALQNRSDVQIERQTSALPPNGMEPLMDLIASGEGGYNSMNQGTRGNRIVGSTHDASNILGRDLTDMTVGEVMQAQSLPRNHPNRLFAAGKYQIIPETMRSIVGPAGVSPNDKFDATTQERLGRALIEHKRPYAAQYIRGEHNDRNGAMLALAQEWASLPDPRTGNSYYGNGNRSFHSVQEVAAALDAARRGAAEQ